MTGPTGSNQAYKAAIVMQAKAAKPDISVFVSANAGSGKTRVLVDRVSRILLAGTPPDKILCLTYTKAAAAEMQTRLFETLGEWSIMAEADLTKALNALEGTTGQRPKQALDKARSLFARALETPGGLKVQTIHAFCGQILRRFPLEAGISPSAEALEDVEAHTLYQSVWSDIEAEAASHAEGKIAHAVKLLAGELNDEQLDGLYAFAMQNMWAIFNWHDLEPLATALGIKRTECRETLLDDFWAKTNLADIQNAVSGMIGSGKTNEIRAGMVQKALAMRQENPEAAFWTYCRCVFTETGKGDVFKTVVSSQASDFAKTFFGGRAQTQPTAEVARLLQTREKLKAVNVFTLTKAFHVLARAAARKYKAYKTRHRLLDFSDQIELTRSLLTKTAAREWVKYKLDGGVDHILVDEAQDTSAPQWDIITAISDEFFQTGANTHPRTLFAVGDEKQSIYGFQGARPELFLAQMHKLSEKQVDTPEVVMSMSFRSSRSILHLVDDIFYTQKGILDTLDPDILPPGSDQGHHDAYHKDEGLVELWPIVPKPDNSGQNEDPTHPAPVDSLDTTSSREKLARAIASQIKTWLDRGEPVNIRSKDKDGKPCVQTRPMQAGDILILVQNRLPFFNAILRNLKAQGVPVAGADRLVISEHIAVQDLVSLAKFCLLPQDDLSLAEVLKSPLFGWDDDKLFSIAYIGERRHSLWAALPQGEEKTVLRNIIKLSKTYAPYEFFARTLSLQFQGQTFRARIYERLGVEATEVIEVFLSRALNHQRHNAPILQSFISQIERSESSIKREQGEKTAEVRIMTVHGAKGLEAPVVILPDTMKRPSDKFGPVLKTDTGFIMNIKKTERPPYLVKQIEDKQKKAEQEYMRLLYVALTRAESRLLVCGFQSGRGQEITIPENSWYDRVEKSLKSLPTQTMNTEFGDGLVLGQKPKPEKSAMGVCKKPRATLPDWARTPVQSPTRPLKTLSPSRLLKRTEKGLSGIPARQPLQDQEARERFLRGNLVHKLLEILPDIAEANRKAKALAFLARVGLKDTEATALYEEVQAVLSHKDFAPLFGPGSVAEVNIAGHPKHLPPHLNLSGQIDRLSVQEKDVWIVDYKSNKHIPAKAKDIPQIYIRQMAAYRALLGEIYPDKNIHTALLWTRAPQIMVIPEDMLEAIDWDDISG